MARYPTERLQWTVPHLPVPKSLVTNLLIALLMVVLLTLLRVWGPQERLRAQASPASPSSPFPSIRPAAEPLPELLPEPGREQVGPDLASGSTAPAPFAGARRFVLAGDTINGAPITDRIIVERIERIAAAVPADQLAGAAAATQVRYVAHAFGDGDDAPIFYGVFREPAAALAFGCAMDEQFAHACDPAPVMSFAAVYEEPPGVFCRPMRLALGAPAYEPDRCEAGG